MHAETKLRGLSFGRAIAWAAILSGGLFLLLVVILPAFFEGTAALGPPRIVGALVIAEDPSQITTGLIVTGVVGHFFLSLVYTYLLALIIYRMPMRHAVGTGVLYGLALYLFNFYMMAVAFPWFASFRSGVMLVSHLVFGLAAAWIYKRLKAAKANAA